MNDDIKCPHCGKKFPLDQAMTHEIKEKLEIETGKKLDEEKKRLNEEARNWREGQLIKLKEKAKEEMELQLKDKSNELEELRNQNKKFQEQLLELNKTLRLMRTSMEDQKLELDKKLLNEQNRIRQDEQKKFEDQYKLKFLEIEKQNNDLKKSLEEARRKAEQGSQQLQGEVLELEFENILRREFPYDEIKEVPKGIRGADILQVVINNYGKTVGTIVWESKRTKSWSEGWITKLKEDQRSIKADLAVIVTQVLPAGIKNFLSKNRVWISNYDSIIGLATVLRDSLIRIAAVRLSEVDKQDKKTILWNYLNGIEFQNRIEAIGDIYSQMQEELEIEKRWFIKKWAKQEKNIRQVIDNISGMDGDLKSIMGKQLPEINESMKLNSGE